MYYRTERKMEGLKALLSLAAIAARLVLSSMAASPSLHLGSGDHVRGADVFCDAGQVCMVTGGGVLFRGERRKMRRAAERRPYAT